MGRIIRTVLIAAVAVVLLVVGAFLIVANFSAVSKEYVCEGETRWGNRPPQKDDGRLRILDYRWWVNLWGDSHGAVRFDSKKIGSFVSVTLKKSGEGNFSSYWGLDESFDFRRSTGELSIRQYLSDDKLAYTFVGECKEDKEAR